jgi:hypothetical protein
LSGHFESKQRTHLGVGASDTFRACCGAMLDPSRSRVLRGSKPTHIIANWSRLVSLCSCCSVWFSREHASTFSHNACRFGYPFFLSPSDDDAMLEIPNPTPSVHQTPGSCYCWFFAFVLTKIIAIEKQLWATPPNLVSRHFVGISTGYIYIVMATGPWMFANYPSVNEPDHQLPCSVAELDHQNASTAEELSAADVNLQAEGHQRSVARALVQTR